MISIIIPVYNEEGQVGRTMEMLGSLEGDAEVIFVDGGSSDRTVEIVEGRYTIIRGRAGRACQMNEGAKHAKGDLVLFLHCDTILESDALLELERIFLDGKTGASSFSLRFDKRSPMLSLIAYLSNKRVDMFGVIFGDQGICVRRALFNDMGGFEEIPIMEDLEFGTRLRKRTIVRRTGKSIVTSARRFENGGALRTIMKMHYLKILYFRGVSPDRLKLMYKDVR
jgi:rSAM/selenodomain-associated transferase 2